MMRVLVAWNGNASAFANGSGEPLPGALRALPETHMSQCSALLLCHWLRQLGHDVTVLVREAPTRASGHFPTVPLAKVAPDDFDALLLIKAHSLRLAKEAALLDLPWRKTVAWLDCSKPDEIIAPESLARVSAFAWGTRDILDRQSGRYPAAAHALCEHATVFASPPDLSPASAAGLYLGRLPRVYRECVVAAGKLATIHAYALSVERDDGVKVLLRHKQIADGNLEVARELVPGVSLHQPVNAITAAAELSAFAFGLCPATKLGTRQVQSASKFYDYMALGLPAVIADNVPEADYVAANPILGERFRQGAESSLRAAIGRATARACGPGFPAERSEIQRWAFGRATYRHRAEVLHVLL